TTTLADISAGSVTNVATATATNGVATLTSNSATATIATAIDCEPRHGALTTNPFRMTIYNYSPSATITISEIDVYFNSGSGQKLKILTLNGSNIWIGNLASPAIITFPSGTITLAPGTNKQLAASFAKTYVPNGTERILVRFAEYGCPILDSSNTSQLPSQ
ncbi:MAG TPA: hypothetical protein VHM28_08485, partial [Anaerolineales bacterium]|nr:hypothetical protein [Anaerolineales bacterium]